MSHSDTLIRHDSGGAIQSAQWGVLIRASFGAALEFYDFVVYSMFAQYIGAAFFPTRDRFASLMLSFAVFAVGYLMRPIGGMVLGHFADCYGRRRIFITSILAMSCSTVAMGLVPTYASWGYLATVAIVMLRVVQGFCLGGELPGAITYVAETIPRRVCFAGGIIFCCVNSGVMLASLLGLVVHSTLNPEQIGAWGWRIGFLFGGLCGLVSFWLRLSLKETPQFRAASAALPAPRRRPLLELARSHPAQVLVGIAAIAGTAGFNGLLFAAPAFFSTVMHYTPLTALQAQNICLVILSAGLTIVSWLGDRMPRRWLLGIGALAAIAFSYPFYHAAASRSVSLLVLFAGAGVVSSFLNGVFAGILADLFPTRIRFSGIAVVLNVSLSLFSGIAPFASMLLVAATHSQTGPAWFMIFCGLLALIASLVLPRYDGRILGELAEREAAAREAVAREAVGRATAAVPPPPVLGGAV